MRLVDYCMLLVYDLYWCGVCVYTDAARTCDVDDDDMLAGIQKYLLLGGLVHGFIFSLSGITCMDTRSITQGHWE